MVQFHISDAIENKCHFRVSRHTCIFSPLPWKLNSIQCVLSLIQFPVSSQLSLYSVSVAKNLKGATYFLSTEFQDKISDHFKDHVRYFQDSFIEKHDEAN